MGHKNGNSSSPNRPNKRMKIDNKWPANRPKPVPLRTETTRNKKYASGKPILGCACVPLAHKRTWWCNYLPRLMSFSLRVYSQNEHTHWLSLLTWFGRNFCTKWCVTTHDDTNYSALHSCRRRHFFRPHRCHKCREIRAQTCRNSYREQKKEQTVKYFAEHGKCKLKWSNCCLIRYQTRQSICWWLQC